MGLGEEKDDATYHPIFKKKRVEGLVVQQTYVFKCFSYLLLHLA